MKYLARENNAFEELIESAGLPKSSFSFSKKGGHLKIQYLQRDSPFYFHRKDKVTLNENGQLEESNEYYVNKDISRPLNWKQVLGHFKIWLDFLK